MKKNTTVRRLFSILIIFSIINTIIMALVVTNIYKTQNDNSNHKYGLLLVDLNEIQKISESGENADKIDSIVSRIVDNIQIPEESEQKLIKYIVVFYLCCEAAMLIYTIYIYCTILKPFKKMERYAANIAKGNLDEDLYYEKNNYFGAFSWAFDNMRKEIVKARNCEKEAIENNKTVIATLSHDIKTPVASIRAYAEALESCMDTSIERRAEYIRVIINKCDEVTELTNDLFIHSISDLNELVMVKSRCNVKNVIMQLYSEIHGTNKNLKISGPIEDCELEIDSKRIKQVLENIITNADKYASGTEINIWTILTNNYEIHIKDHGTGIKDEDMPFIFNKFYRGQNTYNQPGAGLGLYISKYIIEQHDGVLLINNTADGLEVIISLPIK